MKRQDIQPGMLSRREEEACVRLARDDMTIAECAHAMGVSMHAIRKLQASIAERLGQQHRKPMNVIYEYYWSVLHRNPHLRRTEI